MKSRLFALLLLAGCAFAQQRLHIVINSSTPEGLALQQMGQESDDAKKLALGQQFVAKYPDHEGAGWAYAQMQTLYLKQKEYDKAIDAGEKVLAKDPSDLDVAYNNLKAAEGKNDPDLIGSWSAKTSEIARKIMAKAPADDEEKQRVDYARQVDTYTEYALYATALKTQNPKKVVELVDQLQQRNAKSEYLPKLSGSYLNALVQSGQGAKAGPAAEQIANSDPKNLDALMVAASFNLDQNHPDKAVLYASKAVDAVGSNPAPEGMSEADWTARKQSILGRASWIEGVGYSSQAKYGPADKALRVALPLIKADYQLTAVALFHLGLSNYQLGKSAKDKSKMREGLKFFEQAAAMKSPLQEQAAKNVRAIRGELGPK